MSRPKKTAQASLPTKIAHGALAQPRSVYEMIGFKDTPYSTDDVDDYLKEMNKLNMADLQTHAMSVAQIMPLTSETRERLLTRLEKKFIEAKNKYSAHGPMTRAKLDPDREANLKKILSGGQ